jgi:cytochrome c-type biogenesis protein CcmH
VVDFIVARYGEYVLLNPPASGSTWLLWGAGPLMMLLAMVGGFFYVRGRADATAPQDAALSDAEAARLREILKE